MKLDERSIAIKKAFDSMLTTGLGMYRVSGITEWRLPAVITGKTAALRRAKWRSIRARRFR